MKTPKFHRVGQTRRKLPRARSEARFRFRDPTYVRIAWSWAWFRLLLFACMCNLTNKNWLQEMNFHSNFWPINRYSGQYRITVGSTAGRQIPYFHPKNFFLFVAYACCVSFTSPTWLDVRQGRVTRTLWFKRGYLTRLMGQWFFFTSAVIIY